MCPTGLEPELQLTAELSLQPQELAFPASYCEYTISETKMDFASYEAGGTSAPGLYLRCSRDLDSCCTKRLSEVRIKKAVY